MVDTHPGRTGKEDDMIFKNFEATYSTLRLFCTISWPIAFVGSISYEVPGGIVDMVSTSGLTRLRR